MKSKIFNINTQSNFLCILTICIAVFISGYSISNNIKQRNELLEYDDKINEYQDRVQFLIKTISTREYLVQKAQLTELNTNAQITSLNGDTITLNDLIGETDKLFFTISENSCSACIDIEMSILENYVNIIGNNNVIILASYKNLRYLKLFKQQLKIDIDIYNIVEPIGFPIDFGDLPFFYVINSSNKIMNLFIPEKSLPNLSKQYYNILIDEFKINQKE